MDRKKEKRSIARIKLTPENLRTSAQKYIQSSEEVTQVLNTFLKELATISENWEGTAFDSFENQFSELSPKICGFSELLKEIKQQHNKVAEIVEQTGEANVSQIGQ